MRTLSCLLLISDTISVSLQKEKARLKELADPLLCSMLAMFSGERVQGGPQLGKGRPKTGGQQRQPFCPVLKNCWVCKVSLLLFTVILEVMTP